MRRELLVVVLAGLTVAAGVGLLVASAVRGDGLFGYLLGGLFVAAGTARLTIARRG